MDRALREFRVRGVKTNIPFLENVIAEETFRAGQATTTLIDTTPALFDFAPATTAPRACSISWRRQSSTATRTRKATRPPLSCPPRPRRHAI